MGYDELVLDKLTRGSGNGEPRGIITALDANTNDEVVGTTDGAFGQEDIYKTWKAVPQKYRRKASWMMSVDMMNRVRQFGTANVYHSPSLAERRMQWTCSCHGRSTKTRTSLTSPARRVQRIAWWLVTSPTMWWQSAQG